MPDTLLQRLERELVEGTFQAGLGLRFVEAEKGRVVAELRVAETQISRPGVMHGGAVMAVADTLGGLATRVHLPDGMTTTTLESKTNFFRPLAPGSLLRAEAVALHLGRRTMVWQTRIYDERGKLAAQTTQTQAVLPLGG